MSDHDAEREYSRQRIRERRHEIAEGETQLGISVNDHTIPVLVHHAVDALRSTGNPSLADRVTSAYTRVDEAIARLERLNREGVVDERGQAAIERALADWDDALEEFERVEADAKAWLDAAGGQPPDDRTKGEQP
jgi:hypothetical protein